MSRVSVSFLSAALLSALGGACGDTTTSPIDQLNLDRPVDVAFACFGGLRVTNGNPTGSVNDPVILSPSPTTACDFRSGAHDPTDPPPEPPGQEDLTMMGGVAVPPLLWYGFILQQGPGTVVLARFPTKPADQVGSGPGEFSVLDGDPLTPGKNGISVGEDPVAIATDKSGCNEVVANAGSCDLSILDVDSALRDDSAHVRVDRLAVTNAAGVPIRSKPAAMVAEPASTLVGAMCSATPVGLVYVAYPSCHLVAGVDTSTGKIVTGVQYSAAGVPTIVDGNVTCPDECGGAVGSAGTRPVTLDLLLDPRTSSLRMVVGSNNSSSFTMVELDKTTSKPTAVSQIALEDNSAGKTLGVTRVALSPVIGMGGDGSFILDDGAPGGDSQFVYAVATDGTVRVADVLDVKKECDVQADPRFLGNIRDVHELSCLPVGSPTTPQRRAGARGPGIEIPGDGIPTGVTIVRSESKPGPGNPQGPSRMIGYFAAISTSTGATLMVNVDDDDQSDLFDDLHPVQLPVPLAIAHQLRDAVGNRTALSEVTGGTDDPNVGKPKCEGFADVTDQGTPTAGPHMPTTNPLRSATIGTIAAEKQFELPQIRQTFCEGFDATGKIAVKKTVSTLSDIAPELDRGRAFPDLLAIPNDETWSVAYEGTLSIDTIESAVSGPQIRQSMLTVDGTGIHLRDGTKPYCQAGVEPFDIAQMRGCDPANGNLQCPRGYRCFIHPESQLAGLGSCLRDDEADRLAVACKDFLTTLRRYTVLTSTAGELQLAPRRHELRTSPADGCTSDDQCKVLADYAVTLPNGVHPVDDKSQSDSHVYTCTADPLRAPTVTGKRCEQRCDANTDCLTGMICQGGDASGQKAGFCMESIVPPQSCINAPQRYELRAGGMFAVVGTKSGFQHPIIADTNGKCVRNPTANPLLVGRIPLLPPACDPTADPNTGKKPDGTFEPNPCSATLPNAESKPRYLPGTCIGDNPSTELVLRDAPTIRYRNKAITFDITDPFYPGDAKTGCIMDRMGGLGKIPLVAPGFSLSFRIAPGFQPLTLPTNAAFPTKVVRGPVQSVWIIDTGDFLSTSITQSSTRGKVFRIDPATLTTNVAQ